MLGVTRVRRDLGVDTGGGETQRRMNGVVEGVYDVVGRAGVHRVGLQDGLGHRGRLHVDREVAAVVRGSEQRKRAEGGGVVIVGVLLGQAPHGVAVAEIAGFLGTVAVQDLDGLEPVAFPFGRHPRQPLGGIRCVFAQHCQRRFAILPHPDRMVVGLGLAPVGHREIGVDLPCLPEPRLRILVLEVVEQQQPRLEVRLGGGVARGGEVHGSQPLGEALRRCEQGQGCHQEHEDSGVHEVAVLPAGEALWRGSGVSPTARRERSWKLTHKKLEPGSGPAPAPFG